MESGERFHRDCWREGIRDKNQYVSIQEVEGLVKYIEFTLIDVFYPTKTLDIFSDGYVCCLM